LRVFDERFESYLPEPVLKGSTLREYYRLCGRTVILGIIRMARMIAKGFTAGKVGSAVKLVSERFPIGMLASTEEGQSLLILGDRGMPKRSDCAAIVNEASARSLRGRK
jgi:hypothetical protein